MTSRDGEPQIRDILASIQNLMARNAADSENARPTIDAPHPVTAAATTDREPAPSPAVEPALASAPSRDRPFAEPAAGTDAVDQSGDRQTVLEAITRDLMRPMVQEWLDRNLPQLVERLVREEFRSLSRWADKRDP